MSILVFPQKCRSVPECFTDETSFQWRANKFGVIVEVDVTWTLLTGQPLSEVQNMGFLKVVHPDDQEKTARLWHRSLSSGKRFDTTYRLLLTTGEFIAAHITCEPIFLKDGHLAEWLGTVTVPVSVSGRVLKLG